MQPKRPLCLESIMFLHNPSQGRGGRLTCLHFRTYVTHMLGCKPKYISANLTVII